MRSLPSWQHPLLGLDRFPTSLTDFEVEHFFSLSTEELQHLATRRAHVRLGAAIHLGFIKMTGTILDARERIPLQVMLQLSKVLRAQRIEIATTRSLYPRRSTLYEHQLWALDVLGWHSFTDARRRALVREMRKRLCECPLSVDDTVEITKGWLYQRSILIPAARTLRALAFRLQREAERAAQQQVLDDVPKHVLNLWVSAMLRPVDEVPTALEWLQRTPRGRSSTTHSVTASRIYFLRRLYLGNFPLRQLTWSQQRFYGHRMRQRRPARLRTMSAARCYLELACFLHVAHVDLMDLAISLFDFRATDLRRRALQRAQHQAHRLDAHVRDIVSELQRLCNDAGVDDAEFRVHFRTVAPDILQAFMPQAERVRRELVHDHRRVGALLRTMDSFALQGTAASQALDLLSASGLGDKRKGPATVIVPKVWQPLVEEDTSLKREHVLRALTLVTMQRELRNGALWTAEGRRYRAREALFIEPKRWQREKLRWHRQLNLRVPFDDYWRRLENALDRSLGDLAAAVKNREVTLDQDGIHVRHLMGETEAPQVSKARKALFREIGDAQLPDIMVSVDQQTRFSWALLGRRPHGKKELLRVYGAVLALGTELNAQGVAMMMRGITETSIANMMQVLERDQAMREANRRVIDFAWRHDIVRHWGRRDHASADAMSLDASRHLWNARLDPRRRTYSIGIYTHVSEQWAAVYDQPIALGRRQAGAAIEGALRQTVVDDIKRVSVDTHGFTDFAMTLSALLGFELCPRLKDLKDRRLHLPRGFRIPASLSDVVRRDLNMARIAPYWDTLVHLAASVHSGHASAVDVLSRFGDHARGDLLYQAGRRLGQLHRTIFLCGYLSNAAFRQEIRRALALGESYHTLQRAIYRGGIVGVRGRRAEELTAISGALTLLTNIVLAWNTAHMDATSKRWLQQGRGLAPATLRHIAPSHVRHINFRGTFDFRRISNNERLLAVGATN